MSSAYILSIFFCLFGQSNAVFSEWTTLLLLSADENVHPYTEWQNTGSGFNNNVNMTVPELLAASSTGYRNTFIDDWTISSAPDKIKVSYRNNDGAELFKAEFSTTGRSATDWFNMTSSFHSNSSLNSYTLGFYVNDVTWSVDRFHALTLQMPNSSVYFLVSSGPDPLLLPASQVVNDSCRFSSGSTNVFSYDQAETSLTHALCSSICREQGEPFGGVHNVTCSCLSSDPGDIIMTTCDLACEGDLAEPCGGYDPAFISFNYVETDVNIDNANIPLSQRESHVVTGAAEISYTNKRYLYGYDVIADITYLPLTIDIVILYRAESCSNNSLDNTTITQVFTLAVTTPTYNLRFDPSLAQCVYIYLYDNSDSSALTVPVNMTSVAIDDNHFLTATYVSVEASWSADPLCECECWVHNLLYGDSPYNNLTYEEIEIALQNVTEKLERELAVNKSSLSSTIRKKISAEDERPSAAVVGYSLGVALLTVSLGAIFLADVPKLFGNFKLLMNNIGSRFGDQVYTGPTVTKS